VKIPTVGDDAVLAPGILFTIQPGVCFLELNDFLHSDTVVVTEDGRRVGTSTRGS
jgi:Xaa-Pro aminopeptidase